MKIEFVVLIPIIVHAYHRYSKSGEFSTYMMLAFLFFFFSFSFLFLVKRTVFFFWQESIETIVACSAMALLKEKETEDVSGYPKSKWAKWKRGGIIGGAALAGGTLLAVTGGKIMLFQSQLSCHL